MAAARIAAFAMFCFSVSANAQMRTLAVYPADAGGLDSLSRHSLISELQRVLRPAGIDVSWRSVPVMQGTDGEAARVVVASFTGNCSAENLRTPVSPSAHSGVLADTSVADDRILPYFTVACERVLRELGPTLEPLSAPSRSAILGRALARVIAHEIYHIVAQTSAHEDSGLAKPELSRQDLIASRFDLNDASLRRMRASFHPPGQVPPAALAVTLVQR